MSDAVVLALAHRPEHALVADQLVPDRLATLSAREIAALPVVHGGRVAPLGDFFTVSGERSAKVRIEGALAELDGVAREMATGELLIIGDVGRDLGVGMRGGTIEVRGNAGPNVGGALPGAARGMTGGEIVVRGTLGEEAAARMRRGLVVATGDAGPGAGRGMIAGTLIVCGHAARGSGRFVKRGSIVVLGGIERPATFRYACTYRPPHVTLLLRHVRGRYGLEIAERYITGRYERYAGDMAELGKGEILQWVES